MSGRRAKELRKQTRLSMLYNHIDMKLFKNTYRKVKRLYIRGSDGI